MLQRRELHRFQQVVCRRNTGHLGPPLYWTILNEIWCVCTHLVHHWSLLRSQMFAFLLFAILYCYIWVCMPDGTKHCLQPWPLQCHTLHWVFPAEVFLEVVLAHWICSNWLRMNSVYLLPEYFRVDLEGYVRNSDLSSWQIIHSFQLVWVVCVDVDGSGCSSPTSWKLLDMVKLFNVHQQPPSGPAMTKCNC